MLYSIGLMIWVGAGAIWFLNVVKNGKLLDCFVFLVCLIMAGFHLFKLINS